MGHFLPAPKLHVRVMDAPGWTTSCGLSLGDKDVKWCYVGDVDNEENRGYKLCPECEAVYGMHLLQTTDLGDD